MKEDTEENKMHRKLGVEYFNKIWEFIEKPNRSEKENVDMLHYAHASFLHWSLYSGHTNLNIQIGEYILAKAYLHAGDSRNTVKYALDCLTTTEAYKDEMRDFDVAFAHAINAAANKFAGHQDEYEKQLELAIQAGNHIKDKGDRDYFQQDLQKDLSIAD